MPTYLMITNIINWVTLMYFNRTYTSLISLLKRLLKSILTFSLILILFTRISRTTLNTIRRKTLMFLKLCIHLLTFKSSKNPFWISKKLYSSIILFIRKALNKSLISKPLKIFGNWNKKISMIQLWNGDNKLITKKMEYLNKFSSDRNKIAKLIFLNQDIVWTMSLYNRCSNIWLIQTTTNQIAMMIIRSLK